MPSSARASLVLQATATCFRLLPLMLILQNVELVLSNDAETVAFLYPHNLPALGVIGDEGGLCHWIAWPVVRVRLREVLDFMSGTGTQGQTRFDRLIEVKIISLI